MFTWLTWCWLCMVLNLARAPTLTWEEASKLIEGEISAFKRLATYHILGENIENFTPNSSEIITGCNWKV